MNVIEKNTNQNLDHAIDTDLNLVTMSFALSNSPELVNKLNGLVTVKKCFALPMYVLWS